MRTNSFVTVRPLDIPARVRAAADIGWIGRIVVMGEEFVVQGIPPGRGNHVRPDGVEVQVRKYVGTQLPTASDAVYRRDVMVFGAAGYNGAYGSIAFVLAWLAWVNTSPARRLELLQGDWHSTPLLNGNVRRDFNHAWHLMSSVLLRAPRMAAPNAPVVAYEERVGNFNERWPTPFLLGQCAQSINVGATPRGPLDVEYARTRGAVEVQARPVGPWELYPQFIPGRLI